MKKHYILRFSPLSIALLTALYFIEAIYLGFYVESIVINNLGKEEHHYSSNENMNKILTNQLDYITRGASSNDEVISYEFHMSFPIVRHSFTHATAKYNYTLKIFGIDTNGNQKLIRAAHDIPVTIELSLHSGRWHIIRVIEPA